MSELIINQTEDQVFTVTARFSDKYSKKSFLKFTRYDTKLKEATHCNEMFLSPEELDRLGQYLIDQAVEIRTKIGQ